MFMACSFPVQTTAYHSHATYPNQSVINIAQGQLVEAMTVTCWSRYLNSIHIEPQ